MYLLDSETPRVKTETQLQPEALVTDTKHFLGLLNHLGIICKSRYVYEIHARGGGREVSDSEVRVRGARQAKYCLLHYG